MLSADVTRRLIERFTVETRPVEGVPAALASLTPREVDVLRLLARGLSNAEIAAELVLAESTVKTHVVHILEKLGLRDRTQAAIAAYEAGLVRPGGTGSVGPRS
jgi:DNA-binding NarL/FixJ family response regulator